MPLSASTAAKARSVEAAAIAGVVAALLALVSLWLLDQRPDLSLAEADVAAWYETARNRNLLLLALNLTALSMIAFLWFVAVIRRRIGDREDRFFATVFLGSAIAYTSTSLIAAATIAGPAVAVTVLEAATIDTSAVTLSQGQGSALLFVALPRLQAVFILATTNLIRHTGALQRWLVTFGYVVGIGLLVTPIVDRAVGVAFPVWVLVVSVALLTTRPDQSTNQRTPLEAEAEHPSRAHHADRWRGR